MDKYHIILEALQDKVDLGELTLEETELINEEAYNKYIRDIDVKEKFNEVLLEYKQYKKIIKVCLKRGDRKTLIPQLKS